MLSSVSTRMSDRIGILFTQRKNKILGITSFIGVSIISALFVILTQNRIASSQYIFIIVYSCLFAIPFAWAYSKKYIIFLCFLSVSNLLRVWVYQLEYGLFPGNDLYNRFRYYTEFHNTESFVTGTPGSNIFIEFLRFFFSSDISAWESSIVITVVLIPIFIYFFVSVISSRQIASYSAIITSLDFIYINTTVGHLKVNIPMILTSVLLYMIFNNKGALSISNLRGKLVVVLLLPSIVLTHYSSTIILAMMVAVLTTIQALMRHLMSEKKSRISSAIARMRCVRNSNIRSLIIIFLLLVVLFQFWGQTIGIDRFRRIIIAITESLFLDLGTSGQSPAVAAESDQFVGGDNIYLFTYTWVYRFAMIFGAITSLYVYRYDENTLNAIIFGIFMTGLPVMWLFMPGAPRILRAGRIAAFGLWFYPFFISMCIVVLSNQTEVFVNKISLFTNTESSKHISLALSLLIIIAVMGGMSGYKSSLDYSFEKDNWEEADPDYTHIRSQLQLHTWSTIQKYSTEPISAPYQFGMYHHLSGGEVLTPTCDYEHVSIFKSHTKSDSQYLGGGSGRGSQRLLLPCNIDVHDQIYSNSYYVGIHNTSNP